jgi:hypothetical protein
MAAVNNNITQTTGSFVPTTNIWDISEIQSVEVDSPDFRDLLVRLYQNINNIAVVLNTKDSGLYYLQPFINGQVFFPDPTIATTSEKPTDRNPLRLVINFGTLPVATTISIPHQIPVNSATIFTKIYATATNPNTSFIPIPYVDPSGVNPVGLNVDPVNVNITTISDMSAYTICYVVLEYLLY